MREALGSIPSVSTMTTRGREKGLSSGEREREKEREREREKEKDILGLL
jgi:hypothetical protein